MRTEDEPESVPNANQGSGRGIRLLPPRVGRPNPYGVQWAEKSWSDKKQKEVRKVKTEFFPSTEAAGRRANELRRARRAGQLNTASRREIDQWRAFLAATEGTPWQVVVAGWREHLVAHRRGVCHVTVDEHVKQQLAKLPALVKAEKMSGDTARQKKHKWTLFAEQFGDFTLDAVSTGEISDWLDDFDFESMETRDNYLKHIRTLFALAGKIIPENPCTAIEKMGTGDDTVRILPVPQVAALFHTAMTHTEPEGNRPFRRIVGRLAMEFFGGIRFTSATRLVADDVKQAARGIRHPKKSIKTRKRQYIEGFPDHLWQWLNVAPKAGWDLTPRQYLHLKSRLFTVARVPHPRNCARHSFASYHIAVERNGALTAFLLCHVNQQRLWDTYKGEATKAEGELYRKLRPATAEAMARPWYESLPSPA
jgi:hypothetical protein